MRLIKCRKCGTPILPEDTLLQNMMEMHHELCQKSRQAKNMKKANSYIQEAAVLKKMITGIIHQTAQMEDRKVTNVCEMSEIVNYIRENNLVTDEKLDELRRIGREKAKQKNYENQKEIDRIYGRYKELYVPSNQTKADKTANTAIKKVSE